MNVDPRIAWRIARLDKMDQIEPQDAAAWLAAGELDRLAALRDAGVRRSWLAARVLAKQLILAIAREDVACDDARAIEIVSRDAQGRGQRPAVLVAGRAVPWSLSISHTRFAAGAALCSEAGISIGLDLVKDEPFGPGFLRTWFDEAEQESAAAGDGQEVYRLWAVKEAVYKAANRDDSFAPRRIQVRGSSGGGYTCTYRGVDLGDRCRVDVWQHEDHWVALAALDDSSLPIGPAPPAALQTSSMRREI